MSNAVKHLLEFGPFRMDPEQRLLMRDQQPVPLSPKAFELLLVLAQRSGQVVLKEELMNLLWPDTFVEESNLGQHVFQLRKALGERAQESIYIVTVPGRGYRFAPRVRTTRVGVDEEIVVANHSRTVVEEESVTGGSPATSLRRNVLITSIVITAILLGTAALMLPTLSPPKVLAVRQVTHSGRIEPFGKVLSDGARLYFTEIRGGIGSLAQVPSAGGEDRLISTSVPSLVVYDIDPTKSKLLIGTLGDDFNQPLWVVPTAGGSARRLGVLASIGTAWASDGRNIFYGHNAQIFRIQEDGGELVNLLTAPGYITSLRSSPDGSLLRFTVRDPNSGGNSLWESSADGSNLHAVSLGWKKTASQWGEGESCGDWSPDGKYFVFRSVHDGVESFWAIQEKRGWPHTDAAPPVLLYTSPNSLGDPRFSADGKKLVFVNYQQQRELVRYDNTHKLFVPYLGGIPARFLSFSADGKWVAYRDETDGALWRSRVDGSAKLQLTFPPMTGYHSAWSPDGKRIVFGARLPGEPGRLYVVASDGGKPEVLTASEASDGQPSWSPDGRSIIFERRTPTDASTRHSAVYVMDLETRQTRMIPGSKDFDGVHWSPNGKYAAASDQANHKLMLWDFQRQRWSELADGTPYGWGIRWSSDSQSVYYQHSDQGEEQPIFRVRVSDRKVEQITSARQILRSDILGYTMTGLTPDNSPVASLVHRNSDVYALELELH